MATVDNAPTADRSLPQGLRWTFLVHAALATVFGIVFFVVPDFWGDTVGWRTVDPTLTRLYGGGLIGVAVASWLGYQADRWDPVRLLVQFEIAFPAITLVAGLYEVVVAGAPAFTWVIVVITVIFTVAFTYYYNELK